VGIFPKKEGACPKKEINTGGLQRSPIDYKVYLQTTKDHEKLDMDYKVY